MTPEQVRIAQRRTNLYVYTYAALDHPTYGKVLVPIHQTQWSRSKYMPHFGLKERIKVMKKAGVLKSVDILLQGDEGAESSKENVLDVHL